MIKKSTLAVMALLVIIVVVSGCTDNKNKTTNNTQNISNQTHNNSNNTTNNTSNIISAEEAKAIALQYVEEPGVTAGTPVLDTINGRQVYVVPLYQNGKMVGEIEIDAVTGENLGGAGGAP